MAVQGNTRKRYTVQFAAIDPPDYVILTHTNSLKRAQRIFDDMKEHMLNDAADNGAGESEWEIWLFEHPESGAKAEAYYFEDLSSNSETYWVKYLGSKVIHQFSYMDLLHPE